MSKMGQHYQEVQGTAAYRTGFRMAELHMMRPNRKTHPSHSPDEFEALCSGFDDYHNQERQP